MIKALIIDDEESGVQLLTKLIIRMHLDVNLLAPAYDVDEAIHRIDEDKPELIFLDIRLGANSGFDILEKTIFKDYHVIFVTAYSQYALKAIKNSAIDYLLKPIDMDDLAMALERFRMRRLPNTQEQLKTIKEALIIPNHTKLVIPTREGFEFMSTADVLYVVADENYAIIHLENGRSRLASKNLGYFEEQLPTDTFYRIHKSHIVNLNQISNYEYGNGGFVRMSDNKRFEVSRRKKKQLLNLMKAPISAKSDK